MNTLENYIERFSDEELEICFNEIVEWRKEGTLPMEAIVRKVWNEYKTLSDNDMFPIHMMPEAIFYEIRKRKFV